jgi:hypothetical protein
LITFTTLVDARLVKLCRRLSTSQVVAVRVSTVRRMVW